MQKLRGNEISLINCLGSYDTTVIRKKAKMDDITENFTASSVNGSAIENGTSDGLAGNGTTVGEEGDGWIWDDATWILCSSFIIFTMQTGFGMLESGCVSLKNEANIMMKNVVDVVLGGITYWAFGYGFSYGTGAGTNPFFALGNWWE